MFYVILYLDDKKSLPEINILENILENIYYYKYYLINL